MTDRINIKGIDKIRLLQELYSHSVPNGLDFLVYQRRYLPDVPSGLDETNALDILCRHEPHGPCPIGHIDGRPIKVVFYPDNTIDVGEFNRRNGNGEELAQAIIRALRYNEIPPPPPSLEQIKEEAKRFAVFELPKLADELGDNYKVIGGKIDWRMEFNFEHTGFFMHPDWLKSRGVDPHYFTEQLEVERRPQKTESFAALAPAPQASQGLADRFRAGLDRVRGAFGRG